MITAAEALILTTSSSVEISGYMVKADKAITEAAMLGKRTVDLYDLPWETVRVPYFKVQATRLQEVLCDRLTKAGYTVSLGKSGEAYAPRALDSDDMHVNIVINVRW